MTIKVSKSGIYKAIVYNFIVSTLLIGSCIGTVLADSTGHRIISLVFVVLYAITEPIVTTLLIIRIDDYKRAVQKLKNMDQMKEGVPDGTN